MKKQWNKRPSASTFTNVPTFPPVWIRQSGRATKIWSWSRVLATLRLRVQFLRKGMAGALVSDDQLANPTVVMVTGRDDLDGQFLGHLNEYNWATKEGKRTAVDLCVYTDVKRVAVVKTKTRKDA